MKHFLPQMSTVEVREAAQRGAVAILPIGTVEANGLALPLGHDYLIPEALAEAAAKKNGDVWLPPVTYGVSGTLDSYPGTITVSAQFLQKYVEAIVTSLISAGFDHVLLITYHLPNQPPVSWACREIRRKTGVVVPSINPGTLSAEVRADLYPEGPGAFGHGGEPGASLLLHLHPETVHIDRSEPAGKGSFQGLQIVAPEAVAFGDSKAGLFLDIEHVSPSSGWGDATMASAERGKVLFERMVDKIAAFTAAFRAIDTRAAPPQVEI